MREQPGGDLFRRELAIADLVGLARAHRALAVLDTAAQIRAQLVSRIEADDLRTADIEGERRREVRLRLVGADDRATGLEIEHRDGALRGAEIHAPDPTVALLDLAARLGDPARGTSVEGLAHPRGHAADRVLRDRLAQQRRLDALAIERPDRSCHAIAVDALHELLPRPWS